MRLGVEELALQEALQGPRVVPQVWSRCVINWLAIPSALHPDRQSFIQERRRMHVPTPGEKVNQLVPHRAERVRIISEHDGIVEGECKCASLLAEESGKIRVSSKNEHVY